MPATGASAIRVSAVQLSAAGSGFLRLMAERPTPESLTTVAVTRHPKVPNRQPLTAITYFAYLGRLPHVEANFACTYGWKDCHRLSRQKGLDSRRREEQRRELERSAIPSVEAGQALDHFGLGATLLDAVEDALKSGLRLLEGGENLAAEQASQRGGQRGRRLPAFTAGSLLFDRKDHLMVTKELKSLTDRAFAYSKPTLKMVEIEGSWGNIQQGVDFGYRARNPHDSGHAHEEFGQLDLVGLKRLEARATFSSAGGLCGGGLHRGWTRQAGGFPMFQYFLNLGKGQCE